MTGRSPSVEWLIFLALGLMWGSSYLFIKIAVDDFGVFTIVALRLAIGAALLWAAVRLAHQALPRRAQVYGHLAVMSVLNIALPFGLITWAELKAESALAAILTAIVPLLVAILAPLFIPDEPLRFNGIAGLGIGFGGVIVLMSRGLTGAGSDPMSELALVAASLSYAVGGVYTRVKVRNLPPLVPAVFQVTFAMLIAGAVAFALERPWEARPDPDGVLAIAWLGVLGTGLAFFAYFRLLSRWGVTRTSLVAYLIPVVGIVLGFIVLGEPIDVRTVLGTALVISGVALVNSRFGRRLVFARRAPLAKPPVASTH